MSDHAAIQSLQHKIQVLEEENLQLSERAEDSLLLGLIASAIQGEKSYAQIIELALERISILKNIAYCTCCQIHEAELRPIATYASFSNTSHVGHPITVDEAFMASLRNGRVVSGHIDGISFQTIGDDFKPLSMALIPFRSQPIPHGFFLFADQTKPSQSMEVNIPLLQQAVDMAIGRADNQYLLQALHEANEVLEDRIEARTQALSIANEELKTQITERKKSELALKHSNERFMTVLDGMDAQIFVADIHSHEILFMNRKMRSDYGADLLGQKCYRVLRNESKPCQVCTNDQLIDADGQSTGVVVWESQNPVTGNYLINYDRAIPWVDNRLVRLQIGIDVSYVKAIEAEKEKYQQQLAHAQKMEAIGTLAGGIAHDFNNLMTGVQGHVSLMLASGTLTDDDCERLLSIESYVNSASRLTSQLLGMAKKGKYDVTTVDPNEVVRQSMRLFGRTKKEIAIHLNLAKDIWPIDVDQTQIEQVLLNISINAWQAMPDGGEIWIRTENITLKDRAAKANQLSPGRYVQISLKDTGGGIEPSIQEQIFDPFFTTKEESRGTGLGLASVYGIVTNHNGTIEVHSELGKGATFTISLPASSHQPEKQEVVSPASVIKGSGTVLLVDDEEIIQMVGRTMLEEIGYDVLVAESGAVALDLFQQHLDHVEAVVLDVIMPEMSGGKVFEQMKAIDPGVKVLLSSGYSEDGEASRLLEQGCKGFIQKPFNLMELSQKIDAVLKS